MIDVHRLRFLCQLADSGTMTAAAAALSYSPSAVAQHIHALERELGVRLIEPAGRNVQLTPAAHILVRHARPVFAHLETAQAMMVASLHDPQGTVRMAAFQTAAFSVIPAAIRYLTTAHPQVVVEFAQGENEETLPGLLADRHDLVVFERYPGLPVELTDDLTVQLLGADPLWLMVPAAFADRCHGQQDPLRQVVGALPWAMEPPGAHARLWAMNQCQQAGYTPQVRYTSADTLLHLRLVDAGLAVAFIPELALAGSTTTARPVRPFTDRPVPTRQLFTATRRSLAADPAVLAARQALEHAMTIIRTELTVFPPAMS